jgi:hypothetical protein
MKKIILAYIALFPGLVSAQSCENVIELSKIRNTVVQDNSAVEQHASSFCKEYAKSSGKSSSSNFGASYKFLSASFGSSGASMEEVASRYCSSDNIYTASKDAYRQYIESISPGAYGAYEQCIRMSKQDIRFNVDPGSILPTEFSVSASFVSTAALQNSATLTYSSSDDVRCNWDDSSEPKKVLQTGSTALLKCKRENQAKKSYVTIVHSSSGSSLPLTLPWQAYDDHGIPINTLDELKREVDTINGKFFELNNSMTINAGKLQTISTSPTVTIYKCPKGTNGWNPGGAWASYGCQGQISTEAQCTNIEFPNKQNLDCTRLGTIRLF